MAYDPSTGNMVEFGGSAIGYFNDTWTWNGGTWTQAHPVASPPARSAASMAYDPATGNVVLYGGYDSWGSGSAFADTWTWDGTTWTEQSPATSPPGLTNPSMAYDPTSGNVVLFGGSTVTGNQYTNETWTWNGVTWTEQSPATSPPGRNSASMAYDPTTGSLRPPVVAP